MISQPLFLYGRNLKVLSSIKIVLDKKFNSLSIIRSYEKVLFLSYLFTFPKINSKAPFFATTMQSSTYLSHFSIWPWRSYLEITSLSKIPNNKSAKRELCDEPILTPFRWLKMPMWQWKILKSLRTPCKNFLNFSRLGKGRV